MMVTVAVMMNQNEITVPMTMLECGDDNDDNIDGDYVNDKILWLMCCC